MKRLFRVGSGIIIFSLTTIFQWFLLSLIVGDARVANVFSITYPMQMIWGLFKNFFGTGANIRQEKENNKNVVMSSIIVGIVVTVIVFSIITIFVNGYLNFFGQDADFYRNYAIYSFLQLMLQTIFSIIVEKLYFEEREKAANICMLTFNGINLALILLITLLFKNIIISMIVTLIVMALYLIVLFIREYEKFKFDFNPLKNLRYASAEQCTWLLCFVAYFIGLKNAFSAGEEYVAALNFVALCTDAQWDATEAISTVANVDISKGKFNYKDSLKKAYCYQAVIIASTLIMFFGLFSVYKISLTIGLIYLAFQLVDFVVAPIYSVIEPYCQIELSPVPVTIANIVSYVIRMLLSVFILSPFCTDIGQMSTTIIAVAFCLTMRFKYIKTEKKVKQVSNTSAPTK